MAPYRAYRFRTIAMRGALSAERIGVVSCADVNFSSIAIGEDHKDMCTRRISTLLDVPWYGIDQMHRASLFLDY